MPESLNSRLMRWRFNHFLCYRGTGARIVYIADDYLEIRVRLPLNRRTRNYWGTIFGGSLYGAVDPVYSVMLIYALNHEFIVWDKSATIQFKQPGRNTLTARFVIPPEELKSIRAALRHQPKIDRVYTVELIDPDGVVCAEVEKVVHIRRKDAE